jgi:hypothetical protein
MVISKHQGNFHFKALPPVHKCDRKLPESART